MYQTQNHMSMVSELKTNVIDNAIIYHYYFGYDRHGIGNWQLKVKHNFAIYITVYNIPL